VNLLKTVPAFGLFPSTRRGGARKGFTLVEVMVATVLLSMMILGILQVLIGSYRVAAKARYSDHARYIIKSMADQFLTQQTFDQNGGTFTLFQPTVDGGGNLTPLGTGLSWTNTDGSPGTLSGDSLGLYFYVKLGDNSGAPITATVTRTVQYLYPYPSGQPTLVTQAQPAGYLLQAIFSISFPFPASSTTTLTQNITVVRSVP
jgi:prepilin-type N-terminal cleavage/methylation domain-containing protein